MVRSDGASRWDRWTPASRWPALGAVGCLLVAAFVLVTAPGRFDEAAGPWPCDRSDSSLVRSAATGDLDQLQRELAGGRPPDLPDAWGRTALSCAATFDRPEAARLLLANGADPNRMEVDRTSPLAAAARSGDRQLVEVLLGAGAGGRGTPSVTEAADQPSAAPPTATDDAPESDPTAPPRNDVRREQRADLDAQLARAVAAGDVETTSRLLDAGADAGNRSAGVSPMVLAAWEGEPAIVRLLLARGVNPNLLEGSSRSALRPQLPPTGSAPADAAPCAAVPGPTATAVAPSGPDGSSPAPTDEVTVTPPEPPTDPCTRPGSGSGTTDDVSRVLDVAAGASTELVTPLVLAAAAGRTAAVNELLAGGASPTIVTSAGTTAVDAAVVVGDRSMVEALLRAGADPSVAVTARPTAIGFALLSGHPSLVPVLTPGP